MDQLTVGAAIVAVTEGIKRVAPGVNGIVTIIVAGLLGLGAGLLELAGLNWITGLMLGLSSAGAITTVSKISSSK
jgi:hypothetical protein